jgi:hypothetical protein
MCVVICLMQVLRTGETEQLTRADTPNITVVHLHRSCAGTQITYLLRRHLHVTETECCE